MTINVLKTTPTKWRNKRNDIYWEHLVIKWVTLTTTTIITYIPTNAGQHYLEQKVANDDLTKSTTTNICVMNRRKSGEVRNKDWNKSNEQERAPQLSVLCVKRSRRALSPYRLRCADDLKCHFSSNTQKQAQAVVQFVYIC